MLGKMKNNLKNYFSNGPKAVFVAVLLIMCVTITIIDNKKDITVVVDGKQSHITTFRSNLQKILSVNDIIIGPKDKIVPGIDTTIKNGEKVVVKKAVNVNVQVDGKVLKLKSAESKVEDLLNAEKITLDDDDKISPSKDNLLKNGLKVSITRVDSKILKQSEALPFSTSEQNDDNMEKGTSRVVQEGKLGNKDITLKVIIEDGKEVSRKVIGEAITQTPIDRIIANGTLGSITPSRGQKLLYTRSIQVRATAYTAGYASTGKRPGDYGFGITATGTVAKRSVDGYSSIAVDPRVIPLGTKVYVPGYGSAVAEDVGGGVRGNAIDLYFNSDREASNWGVRTVTVYFLK